MSRPTRASIKTAVVMFAAVLLLVFTAVSAASASSPRRGGTLRVGLLTDILSLDPYSRALQQYSISKVIYESLVEFDGAGKPVPNLATSWSFRPNFRGMVIHLRKGVTFHSGAPFNADAVVANFNRARNPVTGQHQYFFTSIVRGATATAPYTVRLYFNAPAPPALALDMLEVLPMVDPSYFGKLANSASGTGPFALSNWTPGSAITLTANRKWWKQKGGPYLNKIVLSIFSDPNAEAAALQSHAIDLAEDVDPARVKTLKKAGFKIVTGSPGSLVMAVHLSARQGPFTNQAYRRAFNYAIDRTSIVKAARAGYGQPIVEPWFTHDRALEKRLLQTYRPDMGKVKSVISKQHISNPDFSILVNPAFSDTIPAAEIIQASFATIGVKVTINQVDSATFTKKLVAGDFDAVLTYDSGGQRYPSFISNGSAFRTKNNAMFGNNVPAYYVRALAASQTALTKKAQLVALHQLENADLIMAGALMICDRPILFGLAKNVHGFTTSIDSMPMYGGTWLG